MISFIRFVVASPYRGVYMCELVLYNYKDAWMLKAILVTLWQLVSAVSLEIWEKNSKREHVLRINFCFQIPKQDLPKCLSERERWPSWSKMNSWPLTIKFPWMWYTTPVSGCERSCGILNIKKSLSANYSNTWQLAPPSLRTPSPSLCRYFSSLCCACLATSPFLPPTHTHILP